MNILIITYWSFNDALIQTYTLPYVRIIKNILPEGSKIYLVTLEKNRLTFVDRNGTKETLLREGVHWVPFSYHPFGVRGFFMWVGMITKLIGLIISAKISRIHCWATPAGAIGYLLSLITRRNLVIDSYEPHAESMVENGTWKKDSVAFRILFWLEKKQTQRAQTVIAATEGMRNYAQVAYGRVPTNFYVKPACVDLDLFNEDKIKVRSLLDQLHLQEKIVCVYAGKFGGIYLGAEVFNFFKVAHQYWGDRFRVLLLSGHSAQEISDYCEGAGLDFSIITLKFVPHHLVPDYMGLADFAITPVKPVPTKRYCTPIKDGEYWALGLPVVIPAGISDDSEIIAENNAGAVLEEFNELSHKKAVESIDEILKSPEKEYRKRIQGIAQRYRSFHIAEEIYEEIYVHDKGRIANEN